MGRFMGKTAGMASGVLLTQSDYGGRMMTTTSDDFKKVVITHLVSCRFAFFELEPRFCCKAGNKNLRDIFFIDSPLHLCTQLYFFLLYK